MKQRISLVNVKPKMRNSIGYFGIFGTALYLLLITVFISGCSKDKVNLPVVDLPLSAAITTTVPANLADTVAINPIVAVTFKSATIPSVVSSATLTLMDGTTPIPGTVTYSGTTVTFTPLADLKPDWSYTATVKSIQKNGSLNEEKEHSWTFKTGKHHRDYAPSVISVVPLNSAVSVPISIQPAVTFSDNMKSSTIDTTTFTLKQGTTTVHGTVSYSAKIATFKPSSNLTVNKEYTGTITTGVTDEDGIAIKSNYTWSFTTAAQADIIPPTVLTLIPADNALLVALNSKATVTFSEAMDPSTITSSTFTLKQGTTVVAGAFAYSGTTATFTPASNLIANTVYSGSITTGVKDLAGNAIATNTVWSFTTIGATSTLAAVDLGAAGNYVILAKSAINNGVTSAITGDLGLSPAATSYITGFALTNATGYATASQVTGKIYAADMAAPTPINLTTAVNNMITGYNDAAGRPSPDFTELATGNIGGKTLTPGLYKWTNTVTIPSDVTISGTATDVWIFQIAGNLTMSAAVKITLNGGAQAKNIFWQVAGQVTLGTTAHFEGIILSKTGITLQTGASLNGKALAQTAVILDKNTVTNP